MPRTQWTPCGQCPERRARGWFRLTTWRSGQAGSDQDDAAWLGRGPRVRQVERKVGGRRRTLGEA
jgi:hypothetical protein